jgi:hypothetical protein
MMIKGSTKEEFLASGFLVFLIGEIFPLKITTVLYGGKIVQGPWIWKRAESREQRAESREQRDVVDNKK